MEFEAFIAPNDTPIGEWAPHVKEALRKAGIFLVVYALDSGGSTELTKEIVLAHEWGIKFETLIDRRVDTEARGFPKILKDSNIGTFEATNPESAFSGILPRLAQCAFELEYSGLSIVRRMLEQ
jgi:hypothetical protein